MVTTYVVAMHTVAVLALDGVVAFDLSTPIEVFARTRLPDGRAAYRVRICAATEQVDAGVFTILRRRRDHGPCPAGGQGRRLRVL